MYCLPGRNDCKAPGGGGVEGVHGFADQVLTQHRSNRGSAIPSARKGRPAGALELNVKALARRGEVFAQQNRSPVSQHGEVTKLMTGIGLGNRFGPIGYPIAGKEVSLRVRAHVGKVQSHIGGQLDVQDCHFRFGRRHRRKLGIQCLRKVEVGVVKMEAGAGH